MSSSLATDFGPNDWFVQEKYEEFLADPQSVETIWRDFFAQTTTTATTALPSAAPASGTATAPSAPDRPPPPAPVAPLPAAKPQQQAADRPTAATGQVTTPLRGVAAVVVKNMTASLEVPTATSVRAVPAKLMADNRIVINNFLKRNRGGKISFTHLIGYAVVRAVADFPNMNRSFTLVDGKPAVTTPAQVNLGLAIDLPGKGGTRNLVVVPIKAAQAMTFTQFWTAYEHVVRKSRTGSLTAEDYAGTTISLTNPGGIGTNHSVPRLMTGQSAIIGVGALEYPAEFQGASGQTLAELGISKIITLTSTYDHGVFQGAESGEFLKRVHPYRTRGHLMADTDPLNYRQRRHPDLDLITHGLTLWDLDREFPVGGFNGQQFMKLRDVLGVLRDAYCRTVGRIERARTG